MMHQKLREVNTNHEMETSQVARETNNTTWMLSIEMMPGAGQIN